MSLEKKERNKAISIALLRGYTIYQVAEVFGTSGTNCRQLVQKYSRKVSKNRSDIHSYDLKELRKHKNSLIAEIRNL